MQGDQGVFARPLYHRPVPVCGGVHHGGALVVGNGVPDGVL